MVRKRDGLRYEPLYKYQPAEGKPSKRKSLWKALLRILTLGLIGGQHRVEFKTKGGEKHVHLSAEEVVVLRLRAQGATVHRQFRRGVTDSGEGGAGPLGREQREA